MTETISTMISFVGRIGSLCGAFIVLTSVFRFVMCIRDENVEEVTSSIAPMIIGILLVILPIFMPTVLNTILTTSQEGQSIVLEDDKTNADIVLNDENVKIEPEETIFDNFAESLISTETTQENPINSNIKDRGQNYESKEAHGLVESNNSLTIVLVISIVFVVISIIVYMYVNSKKENEAQEKSSLNEDENNFTEVI